MVFQLKFNAIEEREREKRKYIEPRNRVSVKRKRAMSFS